MQIGMELAKEEQKKIHTEKKYKRTDVYGHKKERIRSLTDSSSRNPFEIVRGLNVILVDAPLSGVRGFYQYFQRNHIIYLR